MRLPSRLAQKAASDAAPFRDSIGQRSQRPAHTCPDALSTFDAPAPEADTPANDVNDDFAERATPGLHATTGLRFFGWIIGGSHPVEVATDWLTSAWGQDAGNHTASPAAAAETKTVRWLLNLVDFPRQSSVGFVTGATIVNVVCLAAARGEVLRRVGWDVERKGFFGAPSIHMPIRDEAHTTYSRLFSTSDRHD